MDKLAEAFVEGFASACQKSIKKEAIPRNVFDALDDLYDVTGGRLFHVTSSDNVDSILNKGLISDMTGGMGRANPETNVFGGSTDSLNYLTAQPGLYRQAGGNSILPVRGKGTSLDFKWDPEDIKQRPGEGTFTDLIEPDQNPYRFSVTTPANISPSNIEEPLTESAFRSGGRGRLQKYESMGDMLDEIYYRLDIPETGINF